MEFRHSGVLSQRSGHSTSVGSQDVDQPGRAACLDRPQAAHFYGDVLSLPTRTGGGVVEIEVGLSVLLLHPGAVERRPECGR